MDENTGLVLLFGVIAVAVCTFLSIAAWSAARSKERDSYYKSEAIKKVAEMQGMTPEPVLQILREALVTTTEFPRWQPQEYRREREAYYKSETIKRIAEMQGGGAEAVLDLIREEERTAARRSREGTRLGGLISAAVGVGLIVFLRPIIPDRPVYLAGFIPLLVGLVMLGYSYILAPKNGVSRGYSGALKP